MFRCLASVAIIAACAGCSSETSIPASDTLSKSAMRVEFMNSCLNRPEYVARKRAGTLDPYCSCIFNKTMKGLSQEEQITAGFYLYGETHTEFRERLKTSPINPESMMPATQAIDKAVKVCR